MNKFVHSQQQAVVRAGLFLFALCRQSIVVMRRLVAAYPVIAAAVLLMPVMASAQWRPNLASEHSVDWCWANGAGQLPEKTWRRGSGINDRLDLNATLIEAAMMYVEGSNRLPPGCNYHWSGTPTPLPISDDYAGSAYTIFFVNGTLVTDPGHGCEPSYTNKFVVAQCGCNDPRNRAGLKGTSCYCAEPYAWSERQRACVLVNVRFTRDSENCEKCEPHSTHSIYPLTGINRFTENLGIWFGELGGVVYDTRSKIPAEPYDAALTLEPLPSFGPLWESSLHRRSMQTTEGVNNTLAIHFSRGDGRWVSFWGGRSGPWRANPDVNARIEPITNGWRYFDFNRATVEDYTAGQLTRLTYADGRSLVFSYSDANTPSSVAPAPGLLLKVTDSYGRTIQFEYEAGPAAPRVKRHIDASGAVVNAEYSPSGFLSALTWSDATKREFLYEMASLPWAVTGVVDENQVRVGTYGYDTQGRAVLSERAGGVDRFVAGFGVASTVTMDETLDSDTGVVWRDYHWNSGTGITMTGPRSTSSYETVSILGHPRLSSTTQVAGAGSAASVSKLGYDSNGNVNQRDDFNGMRTCYVHDLGRNLQVTRVDGLANAVVCDGVVADKAALPVGSRKISTKWHPDWQLERVRAEPGRLTTLVYNGQPDPFNGNAPASCAPSGAVLPDGKPIVVLCKRVEQATTDADGSQGLGAVVDTDVAAKVWTYTYNQYGQVLTSKGPGTDLNNTTTYEYYPDTTAEHTLGDLKKVTNAKGQVTQYPLYNKAGQVLRMVDANSVTTDYTYDARQRLKTETVAGQTTNYDYLPSGQLKRVTQADASFVNYSYDDAQRLVAVNDNLGNRIDYTLDNAGKRKDEKVKDPGGVLSRQVTRIMDALGRVQQVTGRE